jgi:hypothetical protein
MEALQAISYYIRFYGGKTQLRALSSDLIGSTIGNMQKAINASIASAASAKEAQQWTIYSAHDVTIGTILAVLEMWSVDCIY